MADFDQFSDVFDENEDSISRRVFADADEDIDRRPGEMFHDITIPVVQEMARLWSAVNTVAAVTFIPWSSGVYLDYKGSYEIGLDRREGSASNGELTFVGDLATDIPANTIVRTLAYNAGDPVYEFRTTVNEKVGMELPADTEPSGAHKPNAANGGTSTGPSAPVEYKYSWVGRGGESMCSVASDSFTPTVDASVLVSNIRTGPYGTTARNIYRKADGETDFTLVHTIDNNSDTTWNDDGAISDPDVVEPLINTTDRAFVPAESMVTGVPTNVGAESVISMAQPIQGIYNVFNESPFKGAQDTEDDDAYRERLVKAASMWQGQGNIDDYRRWSAMNENVEDALVLVPGDSYKDDAGVDQVVDSSNVRVILLGPDNTSVAPSVVEEVQERLDPGSEGKGYGYAPIGAIVTVSAVKEVVFEVHFDVYFNPGYSLDGDGETSPSRSLLDESINGYFRGLPAGGDVIWAEVLAALVTVPGVINVKDLELTYNSMTTGAGLDVEIDATEVPVLAAGGVAPDDKTARTTRT